MRVKEISKAKERPHVVVTCLNAEFKSVDATLYYTCTYKYMSNAQLYKPSLNMI